MALPSTGAISMAQVRTELGGSGPISLGDANVRSLAGVPSGPISMTNLHGKSAVVGPTSGTTYTYYYEEFNHAVSASPNDPRGLVFTKTYTHGASGNITLAVQTEGTYWTDGRNYTYGSQSGTWQKNGATILTVTSPTGNGAWSAKVTASTSITSGNTLTYSVSLVGDFRTAGTSDLTRAWIHTGNNMSAYTMFSTVYEPLGA